MVKKGFTTKVLHTPFVKKDIHGALNMPVYDTAAFEFESAEEMQFAFEGKKQKHAYTRISNPTVEHLEHQIKAVTEAFAVTAVASGMAAISNVVISLLRSGDNILTSKKLFGNTYSLFNTSLQPFGINVKYTDFTNIKDVENSIDSNTRMVFLESITNPQLEIPDIAKLSKLFKSKKIVLVADTTLAPLSFFNAKVHGINIEIISSTKYISGGATSVGGLIIDYGNFDWSEFEKFKHLAVKHGQFSFFIKLRSEIYRNFGACLSPHNAYLQSLGLETFALRAKHTTKNALKIAKFLEKESCISTVNYPGLKSSPYYEIAKKQFKGNPGAILTFDLDSQESCFQFINRLKIIRRATNLNDNKSLIIHPATTIFSDFDETTKRSMNIRNTMLRLSVGIESVNNLINDIKQALND